MFYRSFPIETVYVLLVSTPIDVFQNIIKKGHYHWYSGDDLNYFRYPDEELLHTGSNLSDRELEIIMCIQMGLQIEVIARKLFLSPLTIYMHRRNILKKSGKSTMVEVIYDLEGIGIL